MTAEYRSYEGPAGRVGWECLRCGEKFIAFDEDAMHRDAKLHASGNCPNPAQPRSEAERLQFELSELTAEADGIGRAYMRIQAEPRILSHERRFGRRTIGGKPQLNDVRVVASFADGSEIEFSADLRWHTCTIEATNQ